VSDVWFGAEADKIQDLIFRSSRLSEVVGGSQRLTRFCDEFVDKNSLLNDASVVVNDGGSFRIRFGDQSSADAFGAALAESYFQALGSTLTVAPPVALEGGFKAAQDELQRRLIIAKRNKTRSGSTTQFPYLSLCASCGQEIATEHGRYVEGARAQYICATCRTKHAERKRLGKELFLSRFYEAIDQSLLPPGHQIPRPEDIGAYDSRGYVAYLFADGNGMGRLFANCQDEEQLKSLSNALSTTLYRCLGSTTSELLIRLRDDGVLKDKVPVLPFILGGDDLFAMLPAPWALHFAQRLAQTYTGEFEQTANGIPDGEAPTIGLAVVVAKANYPYTLAYHHGHDLLENAKQVSKRLNQAKAGEHSSAISFAVITSNQLPDPEQASLSLKPYFVDKDQPDWGLGVEQLLSARHTLRALPGTRLHAIGELFARYMTKDETQFADFSLDFEKLLKRLAFHSQEKEDVDKVLLALGGNPKDAQWFKHNRGRSTFNKGHGFPDLIEAWRFLHRMDQPISDYREEKGT
jgi:hypothetical protein